MHQRCARQNSCATPTEPWQTVLPILNAEDHGLSAYNRVQTAVLKLIPDESQGKTITKLQQSIGIK